MYSPDDQAVDMTAPMEPRYSEPTSSLQRTASARELPPQKKPLKAWMMQYSIKL